MSMRMSQLKTLSEHERRVACKFVLLCENRISLGGKTIDLIELDQKGVASLGVGDAPLFDIPPVLEALKQCGFIKDFWLAVARNRYPENPDVVDIDEISGKRRLEVPGWRRNIRSVHVVVLSGVDAQEIPNLYRHLNSVGKSTFSERRLWFFTKKEGAYYFKGEQIMIAPKTAPQIVLDALVEIEPDEDGVITYEAIAKHAAALRGGKPFFSSVKRTRNFQISHAIGDDQGFLYIGKIGKDQKRLKEQVRFEQILKNVRGKGYQLVFPRSTKK